MRRRLGLFCRTPAEGENAFCNRSQPIANKQVRKSIPLLATEEIMADQPSMSTEYSYLGIAIRFLLGGIVTAAFSGSLVMLAKHAGLTEVLAVGMVVPSFTWVVQLSASALGLGPTTRRLYWGDLGHVCLLGSLALLPAAVVNLAMPGAPLWISAVNVLASVAFMAAELFRQTRRHGIAVGWPISWCLTITLNMAIFVWSSWKWWGE
jgi:hypothetical protein